MIDAYINRSNGSSSADKVITTILEGLVKGDYKPGDRVNARQLSEDLEISIVPVREALHILAGEGVIDLLPNKGARIRSMNPEEVANWWQIFGSLALIGIRFTSHKIKEGNNAATITQLMEKIRRSAHVETPLDFIMRLFDLHYELNELSNPQINEAVVRLSAVFWAIFLPDFVPVEDYWDDYVNNHQRLVDSILAGDAEGAVAIYRYHINWLDGLIKGQRY